MAKIIYSAICIGVGVIITISVQNLQQALKDEVSEPKIQITELNNKLSIAQEKEKKLEKKVIQIETQKIQYEQQIFDLRNQILKQGPLIISSGNTGTSEQINSNRKPQPDETLTPGEEKEEKNFEERVKELKESVINDNAKINELIELLDSPSVMDRLVALSVLRELKKNNPNTVVDSNLFLPHILNLLSSKEENIRLASLGTLIELQIPIEMVDKLLPMINDSSSVFRSQLLWTLVKINEDNINRGIGQKTEVITPAIAKLLTDRSLDVVDNASRTCLMSTRYYSPEIETAMLNLSKGTSPISTTAINILLNQPNKSETVCRRLIELINDPNSLNLHPLIISNLWISSIEESAKMGIADAVFTCVNNETNERNGTKSYAILCLEKIGNDYAKAYLKRIADSHPDKEIRDLAQISLNKLSIK